MKYDKRREKSDEGPALVVGIGGDADEDDSVDMGDEKDIHLDAAYDAIKGGDREGFKDAMKKCLLTLEEGGYTGPDEGDEE